MPTGPGSVQVGGHLLRFDPMTFCVFALMCAMSDEYTGASRHRTTISRNSPPKNSETLLRRSRRQASLHGPSPGGTCSPSAAAANSSAENSVPVGEEVAIQMPRRW